MKLNWKTIVGLFIIFGSLSEFFRIFGDYRSGAIEFWPIGVETGIAVLVAVGIWLIRSGNKK